jgi:hypothetical protein
MENQSRNMWQYWALKTNANKAKTQYRKMSRWATGNQLKNRGDSCAREG